ncbi:MAG: 2-C-methyl-D-erythritol 4-phosphate cytidylyltransferase [Firmicutes bacterium]|nr:2-C-methyl-D-erythritol 4-phosphate cytidylyltransferase [Bacillota bacterium]
MEEKSYQLAAVIPAAGSGSRLGAGMSKGLVPLAGRPLLWWAVTSLFTAENLVVLVVAAREEERETIRRVLEESLPRPLPVAVVPGGAERTDSVRHGLEWLAAWEGWWPGIRHLVAIHDAARPFLPRELWERLLTTALEEGAAVPGLPIVETVKRVDAEGKIAATVDRQGLWRVQTPQIFGFEDLLAAYRRAAELGLTATDDAQIYEWTGRPVRVIPGVWKNIKITTREDLALAEAILRGREENV